MQNVRGCTCCLRREIPGPGPTAFMRAQSRGAMGNGMHDDQIKTQSQATANRGVTTDNQVPPSADQTQHDDACSPVSNEEEEKLFAAR